jgi:phosphate transport system permease protein
MNLPRSAPTVSGLTLALMTMPVIVIARRNAIKSVTAHSIRTTLRSASGASKDTGVASTMSLPSRCQHPTASTIIGMARALE